MTLAPVPLLCHPARIEPKVLSLTVTARHIAGEGLALLYRLEGEMGALAIPSPLESPGPTDGLWQHTCFEAFVSEEQGEAYHEFNFAPSGAWAAYGFEGYRARNNWQAPSAPSIALRRSNTVVELEAFVPAALLPSSSALVLGLTAVVESSDKKISYWALKHPSEKPDFHHRGGFVLPLGD